MKTPPSPFENVALMADPIHGYVSFTVSGTTHETSPISSALSFIFLISIFFLINYTGKIDRYRRIFFIVQFLYSIRGILWLYA